MTKRALTSPLLAFSAAFILLTRGFTALRPSRIGNFRVTSPFESAFEALVIVSIALVTLTLFYILVKKQHAKFVRAFRCIAITITSFSAIFVYLVMNVGLGLLESTIISLIASAPLTYALIRTRRVTTLCAFILASFISVDLLVVLPEPVIAVLLVLLPIYDIFIVYYGPLGKVLQELHKRGSLEVLSGFTINIGGLTLGLGDLTVYALLAGFTYVQYVELGLGVHNALLASILSSSLQCLGLYLTIRLMLKRRKYAPGLPLPLLLGSAPMLVLITPQLCPVTLKGILPQYLNPRIV